MGEIMYVIKKTGRKEKFDEKKIYKSAYNACLSTEMDVKTAKKISQDILNEIKKSTKGNAEIKSDVIFNQVKRTLARHNKECAFMYETHRDVS